MLLYCYPWPQPALNSMGFTSAISLICCCVVICLRIKTAQAQVEVHCYYDKGNFTANSTYSKNRDTILSSLASKDAANGGFYNSTVGHDSDTIYATALCAGSISKTECSHCVNTTAINLISECPLQYEAISWSGFPTCIIHYANKSIFGVLEMDPSATVYTDTTKISWNPAVFYDTWDSLMVKLKNKAAAGSSELKYATGKANFTVFQSIYALVQCTPDLSQSDCQQCLTQSIADGEIRLYGYRGGFIRRPNCIFRWDLYPFFNQVDNAPPPSPPLLSPPRLPSPPSSKGNRGLSAKKIDIIVGAVAFFIALVVVSLLLFRCQRKRRELDTIQQVKFDEDVTSSSKILHLDFRTIRAATDNFSDNKKLGQGGFGPVYKGTLPNGQEIAVKRLSRNSLQGELEFKTEVKLMTKLRHRNLVRLIGYSMEKEERVLVYEFLPNSSLDHYIFNPNKGCLLDWTRRYHIISGIARGLLYLHEDSHLKIIHRDLKPSNILIDAEMNAKIADFGTARLFAYDQTQDNTSRISGTFGYMAPEYVTHGQFSAKSDVFSFGVLALEIISGQRNMRVENGELIGNLVTNAWRNWDEGNALNLVDPTLESDSRSEMLRCIHIGLLCVQENAADRPNMASVVLMLSTESLPLLAPLKPGYFLQSFQNRSESVRGSTNGVTISDLYPR